MPARPEKIKLRPPQKEPAAEHEEDNPQVIVDVVFDAGILSLCVTNLGDQPVWRVSVQWEPAFRGLGGTQSISDLPLFKNIEFLAPHKSISTLLDSSRAYFQRGEATRLTARLTYLTADHKTHTATIVHDLSIYQDLTYLS